MEQQSVDLSALAKKWQHPYVCRKDMVWFSAGMATPAAVRNDDAAGIGPAGRLRVGRTIAYPVKEVIRWLESKAELLD